MPKRAAASTLVVAATKCSATSRRRLRRNQAFAVAALAIVSWVVKVLLATMNRVSAGARGAAPRRCRGRRRWRRSAARAGWRTARAPPTAICGPRSQPPMPMLTTWRSGRARRRPASAPPRRRRASPRAWPAPRPENGAAPRRRAQGGVQHRAAFGEVDRLAGEHRVAPGLDAAFARQVGRKCSVAASSRFFDRSQNTSGASTPKRSKRAGSRAKASRRSRSRPWASKWPRRAAQAAVASQRGNEVMGFRSASSRSRPAIVGGHDRHALPWRGEDPRARRVARFATPPRRRRRSARARSRRCTRGCCRGRPTSARSPPARPRLRRRCARPRAGPRPSAPWPAALRRGGRRSPPAAAELHAAVGAQGRVEQHRLAHEAGDESLAGRS